VSPTEFYGQILALGMVVVVVGLLAWQMLDIRRREPDLSEEDRYHFRRQDVRRGVVAVVMLALAAGIYLGSHTPHRLHGRPNPLYLEIWVVVFGLLILLLALALIDWLATRRYARRHRSAIVREGLSILREEMRLRLARPANGQPLKGEDGAPGAGEHA
jgi:hypothetical protein